MLLIVLKALSRSHAMTQQPPHAPIELQSIAKTTVLLEEVCGAYAACIKLLFAVAFILPSVPSETLKWTRRAFERVGTALTQSSGAIAFLRSRSQVADS